MHCLVVALLPTLMSLIPDNEDQAWRKHAFVVRPLELQLDDRFFLPASSPAPAKPEGAKAPSEPGKPEPPKAEEAKAPSERKASKPAPRRFELPKMARRADVEQTILQPQYPLDMTLQRQVRLPNVALWSAQPRLPKPTPKRFVQPGRDPTTPPALPSLDAPPKLEPPNQESLAATLKMTGPSFSENPKLPMPRGTSMPIRVFRPPSGQAAAGGSLDTVIGEPINLIAISQSPAPPEKVLLVPAGNQLGQLPDPPSDDGGVGDRIAGEGGAGGTGLSNSGSGLDAGAASDAGGGTGGSGGKGGTGEGSGTGGPGGRGSGTGGSGTGGQGSRGTGSGGSGTGGGGTGGTGSGGTGIGSGGSGGAQLLALGMPSSMPSSVSVRIVEPVNSVADIVVQSTASHVVPEAAGILSGKPVYTVYLRMATRKEWMLQYCKPASRDRQAETRGGVVYLGADAPVKAPYLIVRRTPPITLEPRANSILVHGLLDVTGRLKDLAIVRESDRPLQEEILPYLQEWEFRPGTQDGRPVLLEILLVIPTNHG
jgi:hypothetical protein